MRRRAHGLLLCCLAAALFAFVPPEARATSVDPLIWEQLVAGADFVGVVECETAGGIVAGYRVVESWKGAAAGSRFRVRTAVDFWEPQFPVALVGERYLLTAFKAHDPTRISSMMHGGPVPLWWRDIPADYHLPLFQGAVRLPPAKHEHALSEVGFERPDLEAFKKAAHELLALSPEAREVRVLRALSHKYLSRMIREREKPAAAELAALQRVEAANRKIQASAAAREIVAELLDVLRLDTDEAGLSYPVTAVLSQGGGQVTLGVLKAAWPKGVRLAEERRGEMISNIEERLGLARPTRAEEEKEPVPSARKLAELREALARGPEENRAFDEAFTLLTRYDPAPVAEFLVAWRNPEGDWRTTDFGYHIGSYFAWRCGKDREANLLRLLNARDPFVRVAGAVYLAFENPSLAAAKLEELSRLPGDAGVWAALNLARRGHKGAVPRALEVFATSGARGHMSGAPHRNLQKRLTVLLSNSAAAGGLPQPSPPPEPHYDAESSVFQAYQERLYRYYADWWREHGGKVKLTDPWLPLLERQKVD